MTNYSLQLSRRFAPPGNVNRAFTLIELLVVIAIIALLAAILFPVFARARDNARRSSCQSNLKQLGIGFSQYLGDYDQRFPHAWDLNDVSKAGTSSWNSGGNLPVSTTDEPVVWPAKIMPYVGNRQVFMCPSFDYGYSGNCETPLYGALRTVRGWRDSDPVVGSKIASGSYVYTGASFVHYGYNTIFLGGGVYAGATSCQDNAPSNGIGPLESELEVPASTLLLVDNNFMHGGVTNGPAFALYSNYTIDPAGAHACRADGVTTDTYDSYDGRHFDGMNVLFTDGHVKWMKKEAVLYKPAGTFFTCNANVNWSSKDPLYIWNRK